MKFLVVAIAQCSSGGLSVLRDFYNYINQNTEDEWEFWLSDTYIKETDKIRVRTFKDVKRNKFNRLVFDLFTGRRYVEDDVDAVFYLQNNLIYGLKCPQTVYMDQPIPFQNIKKFSFFKKGERGLAAYQYLFGILMKDACKKADNVIVQTRWIENAIINQCQMKEESIHLVAPSITIQENIKNAALLFDETQFFYPATDLIYKNHECIIRAIEILKDQRIRCNVRFTIDENDNRKSNSYITYGGTVSREEVYRQLRKSTLIFPSYIESYGMPLAEARAVGTIILVADTEFSRELLQGYENALFFDYDKPEELAELMKMVIKKEISKKNISEKMENNENSWGKIVEILKQSAKQKTY